MIKYFDDENLIIRLWHEAFGDSDEDIVFFLKNCKHKKIIFAKSRFYAIIKQDT